MIEDLKNELYEAGDGKYENIGLCDGDNLIGFKLITDIGEYYFIETEDKNIFVCDELEMEYFQHHQTSGYSYI